MKEQEELRVEIKDLDLDLVVEENLIVDLVQEKSIILMHNLNIKS